MRSPIKISNWAVANCNNPYLAPELLVPVLTGNIDYHPRFNKGGSIQSSSIRGGFGKVIRTESGSTYELIGNPNPEFVDWINTKVIPKLKEIGYEFDWEEPIASLETYWGIKL